MLWPRVLSIALVSETSNMLESDVGFRPTDFGLHKPYNWAPIKDGCMILYRGHVTARQLSGSPGVGTPGLWPGST